MIFFAEPLAKCYSSCYTLTRREQRLTTKREWILGSSREWLSGRASASQADGREFESRLSLQIKKVDGVVAEWLGGGLQNLSQQFNSARRLQRNMGA